MLLRRVLGMAALLPVLLYGASDGWDNINPDRPEAPAGKVFWSESFEKKLVAESLNIEFRNGATGEVKVVSGVVRSGGKALLIKKTNSLGYIKISPKNPCIVPAKQQLQSVVYVHCRNANPGFMPAFIRMYGKKESLAYFKALDGRGSAGPKMDYLVNTPPGSWERKICRLQVNDVTGTAITPAIIVAGPPSESIWDDWKIEDLKGALKNWQKHIAALDAVKQPDDMVSEADFDAALAKDIDHTAKIMTRDGIARLYIDGKEEIPVLFKDSSKKRTDRIVSGAPIQSAGVKIRAITLRLGNSPKQYGPWTKDGFDVAAAVKFIRDRMRGSNESVFLISLLCHAYPEFTQEHPEEIWIDPKGRKVYGHNVHAYYWLDQPMDPNRHWYWVSMHSLVWREAVKKQIGILIDELKRTGLSKRIVGVHIGGFHDQQFATRHMDISKPAVEGFRRYLKRKYGTIEALEKAWGRKGLDFATIAAPQFGKKEFFVPGQDQDKIDFYDFQKTGPFEAQEDIAAFAKQRLGKDVIAVRWCMEAFGGTLGSALDITAFVNSKVIDILCAQPNYPTRTPGLPNEVRLPLASFHLNNKIFIDEFDLRTYGKISNSETEMRVLGLSQALDYPMWQSIHHKLAGKMIAGGMGYWYFDMAGGWFNPPEILDDISQVNKIRRVLSTRSVKPWKPSMVLVVDEAGLKLRNVAHEHYCFDQIRLVGKQNEMLSSSGVPYELRLLDDFLKNPELAKPYKVVIFAGMYHIDAKRKALIEFLQQDNRMLIYLAGTGALGGSEVTGFEWKKLPRGKVTHEIVPAADVTMNMLSAVYNEQLTKMLGVKFQGNYHCPSRYSVAENDGVKVWSRFKADQLPAVATVKLPHSCAVAVGSPAALTPEFVNYLARQAGAYVPSQPGLQINMNGQFMSIHALIPGKYQIDLPFACQVRNLKSGKMEQSPSQKLILDAEAGSTYWFALENN